MDDAVLEMGRLVAKERVMEEEIRRTAVRRYILAGESPKSICVSLNRSKQWFYKWLNRYNTQGRDWHRDRNFPAHR
jgi:transposase